MIRKMYLAAISGLICAVTLVPATAPRADAVADFYRGRTITIVLGTETFLSLSHAALVADRLSHTGE